jgi:hypothetical protein
LWRVKDEREGEASHLPSVVAMPLLYTAADVSVFDWLRVAATTAFVAQLPTSVQREVGRSGWAQTSAGLGLLWILSDDVSLQSDVLFAVGGPLRGTASLGFSARWCWFGSTTPPR